MKTLIVGLESSCTKIVSKLIAMNYGIVDDIDSWDGNEGISNPSYEVTHRSMPHGDNRYITTISEIMLYDYVIIVTRDYNCSLLSKIKTHQPNVDLAVEEHRLGLKHLKNIITHLLRNKPESLKIFSAETAMLLGDSYVTPFLLSIGVKIPITIEFLNVNEKYLLASYQISE